MREEVLQFKEAAEKIQQRESSLSKEENRFLSALSALVSISGAKVTFPYGCMRFVVQMGTKGKYMTSYTLETPDAEMEEYINEFGLSQTTAKSLYILEHSDAIVDACIEALKERNEDLNQSISRLDQTLA
ncbi:MAG: hypothetical protein K9L28_00120 [Synergistales bacterium]|nr:hypothetical protein [Synergistales bacterium]